MRAGQLRNRITLQRPIETQDNFGAVTIVWRDVGTVYASIEPLTGNERYAQGEAQEVAERDTRIIIRYRAGVAAKMRAVWTQAEAETIYDIERVINTGSRNRQLILMCREVDDG